MKLSQIFGLIGAILSTILYLPQLYHIIIRKSADDLSYIFLGLTILATISWVIYGVLEYSLPIIICDSIICILTIIMLILKFYYATNIEKN